MLDFEEQPTGFSLTNALYFAEASRLTYQDRATVEKEAAEQMGLDGPFSFFDKGDTQAFLASDADKAMLAFRGTEVKRKTDILADLKFRKVPGAFGKRVHRGFKDALDQVWGDVDKAVSDLGDRRLWIAGHSLGGALAVLAAARLAEAKVPIAGVYALGQPRVGGGSFNRILNQELAGKVYRIVNFIDIVPRVPPLIFGFRHEHKRVYITSDGEVVPDAKVWAVIREGLAARGAKPFSQLIGVDEHNAAEYIGRLRGALEKQG